MREEPLEPREAALKALYDALLQAKPYLNVKDPVQEKLWGAMDHLLLQLQTAAPLLRRHG